MRATIGWVRKSRNEPVTMVRMKRGRAKRSCTRLPVVAAAASLCTVISSLRLQRGGGANQHIDGLVDMHKMSPEGQDRAAQPGRAADAGSAEEHPPLLLHTAQ